MTCRWIPLQLWLEEESPNVHVCSDSACRHQNTLRYLEEEYPIREYDSSSKGSYAVIFPTFSDFECPQFQVIIFGKSEGEGETVLHNLCFYIESLTEEARNFLREHAEKRDSKRFIEHYSTYMLNLSRMK
jgi:hypothetical protein